MKKILVNETVPDWEQIKEAVSLLRQGRIVALPTETVYGLGVISSNNEAVQKLYKIKNRPLDKPFTLCVADTDDAVKKLSIMPPFGFRILEQFWPGPLTVVFYSSQSEEKIGLRVPDHYITSTILRELNTPVYLPSANISGQKEASSAEEVESVFSDSIDLIVDTGKTKLSTPSTVIDLTFHPFKVLREGAVSLKDLMMTFFRKRIMFVCTGNTCRSPMAEYALKNILEEKFPYLIDRYEIISRGTISLGEEPASAQVLKVLSDEEGINADTHRSRKINRQDILSSDFIFVMEQEHKDYVVKLEPTAEARIFPLRKFLSQDTDKDIADPIGKPLQVYEEVFFRIKEAIQDLAEWLS